MIEKVFYVLFFTIMFYLLYKIYNDIKFVKGKLDKYGNKI